MKHEGLPDHPFWDFSLALYGTKGVAPACLALQEGWGVDVNLLLFCCWAGASGGGALGRERVCRAMDAAASWHDEVVRPLRRVRKRLKPGIEPVATERSNSLRSRLQALEIEAEHMEQIAIAESVPVTADDSRPAEQRIADTVANLAAYIGQTAGTRATGACHHLTIVLSACFPEADGGALARQLSTALQIPPGGHTSGP